MARHPGQHNAGGSVSRPQSKYLLSIPSESMSNILLSDKSSRQNSYAEVPIRVTAPESYGGQHLPFSSGSVMTSAAQPVGSGASGSSAAAPSSTGQALNVLDRVLAGRKVRDWTVVQASQKVCFVESVGSA